jgi:hypothetical protein
MKVKLVEATRELEKYFYTHTTTGKSINLNVPSFLEVSLFPNNKEGISNVNNHAQQE